MWQATNQKGFLFHCDKGLHACLFIAHSEQCCKSNLLLPLIPMYPSRGSATGGHWARAREVRPAACRAVHRAMATRRARAPAEECPGVDCPEDFPSAVWSACPALPEESRAARSASTSRPCDCRRSRGGLCALSLATSTSFEAITGPVLRCSWLALVELTLACGTPTQRPESRCDRSSKSPATEDGDQRRDVLLRVFAVST